MVSLHIAKLLSDEGFGNLDEDIFWESMPIDGQGNPLDGTWVVTRGAPLTRFDITTQQFDIYTRYTDKVTGSKKLEDILEYLQEAYSQVCELPAVEPYSSNRYYDVKITPVSGIENVGMDDQNKVVRSISGEIKFKKES